MSDAWIPGAALAVARRPDLWPTLARLVRNHAAPRWWATRPHLPLPDRAWLDFRFETALASPEGRPRPGEVIQYLEWARTWRHL